jgi:hypothetical protein
MGQEVRPRKSFRTLNVAALNRSASYRGCPCDASFGRASVDRTPNLGNLETEMEGFDSIHRHFGGLKRLGSLEAVSVQVTLGGMVTDC